MRTTLKQLSSFIAIAKQGNVTRAATALHLSQSAVSMALAELEKQLEVPLFDRVGKRLILNEYGKNLLPKVTEILSRTEEIEQFKKQNHTDLTGTLRIGASTTIGNYFLPIIISQFIKKHPHVKMQLVIANTNKIINDLLKFNVDVGFIEGSCKQPELIITPWQKDELVVFSAPQHPLAKKKKLQHHVLTKTAWILREAGSGTREVFEKAINTEKTKLNTLLEPGSSEAIKQAVMTGIGIGCLSKCTISHELKQKRLIELPTQLNLKRNLYLLLHQDKYQTQLLQEFLHHTKIN